MINSGKNRKKFEGLMEQATKEHKKKDEGKGDNDKTEGQNERRKK